MAYKSENVIRTCKLQSYVVKSIIQGYQPHLLLHVSRNNDYIQVLHSAWTILLAHR